MNSNFYLSFARNHFVDVNRMIAQLISIFCRFFNNKYFRSLFCQTMHTILETPRLILRQFTEADACLVLALNSQPETVKYLHEPLLKTTEDGDNILVNVILPQYKNNLGR